MGATNQLNNSQRKIISTLYRIIIFLFAWFIIVFKGTELEIEANLIITFFYLAVTQLLSGRKLYKSILRLLIDYIFITFIVWQVKVLDIYTYALIFIPILNSQNHSGPKKTILLYVLPLITIYIVNLSSFSWWMTVPFFFFLLINGFSAYRTKYSTFIEDFNDYADRFFEDKENYTKSHTVYNKVIEIINKNNIFLYPISAIHCIHVKNKSTSLVNGSSFIWDLTLEDEEEFIQKAKSMKYFTNHKIIIDKREILGNLVINCNVNKHTYSFLLIPVVKANFIDSMKTPLIVNLFRPFLFRYSRILKSSFEHKMNEINQLQQLQEKFHYVTNSVNAMHFIRNKLTPLKNYLAMVDDFNKASLEKKKKIEPYLKVERKKLHSSIGEILDRADFVLKKSNNPFNVYKTEPRSLRHLYRLVSIIWMYHFNEMKVDFSWSTENLDSFYVKYNDTGLELVISNWISNMYKNNNGQYGIKFIEDFETYGILFSNSITEEITKNLKFIDDYNNPNRDTINRRDTHGLLEIKDFIGQMGLQTNMYFENKNIYFLIKFKKYEKAEDINS